MGNTIEIEDLIMDRALDENLHDLIAITRNNNYRLNLISYNSALTDFFKGVIDQKEFDVRKIKIWDAVLFFLKRESAETLNKLAQKIGGAAISSGGKDNILYVAASPKNALRLQTDFEYSKIEEALAVGASRDNFELLKPLFAATLEDFMLAKHKYTPAFIHFSGHGTTDGLIFTTANNEIRLITEDVLKEVFLGINQYAKCIVLNACYAAGQAKIISGQGVYVVGMNAPISDTAAIFLSEKFYRALSEGQDVESAFRQTKTLLLSENREQVNIPELWKDGLLVESL